VRDRHDKFGGLQVRYIHYYFLSVKYWLQGDDWVEAKSFAWRIVGGFK